MALTGKTFRIFVSSTFSDMKEERNALQKQVFPRLRELCLQHGTRFQAIDLRWGIRQEAALDQQTMKICLNEIDHCQKTSPRPNFIILLGNRYGWHPLPAKIPAPEFEGIEKQVNDFDEKALLNTWYRRDDNQVPSMVCLQPRKINISSGASDTEKEKAMEEEANGWIQIENKLRQILVSAIKDMSLNGEQKLKFTASATEQEIFSGAMQVEDAPEHVFCFFRNIKNLPSDNNARDFIDLDEKGNISKEAQDKLRMVKDNLHSKLPGHISEYEATWSGRGISIDHLEKLCEDVYKNLSRIILEEISQMEEIDPLEKEIDDHVAFGIDRAGFFTGRATILQIILAHINGTDNTPLVVYGDPGSGKSALLAKAFEQAQEKKTQSSCTIRFVGATPRSLDIRTLLDGLCRQVTRIYGADESDIPTDYKELVDDFPKRLALATVDRPLIIFLDALDQLSNVQNARNLAWLPSELPKHVHMVVSLLPGNSLKTLKNKLKPDNLIELAPMPADEGENLLELWLKDAGRTLQKPQKKEIIEKFRQNGLPLYLKLAFECSRQWHSYTEDFELSPDISGLIQGLFSRISDDANHGEMLVSRSLGYIAASKNGLSEDELLDILSRDEEVYKDFEHRAHHSPPEKRIPVVVWSRLYFDLEPYMIERSADNTSLMTFYHPTTFGNEVKKTFLSGAVKTQLHQQISKYFEYQDLYIDQKVRKIPNRRKLSELPYQQTHGACWDELEKTLTNLYFIEAKCSAGMSFEMIWDYTLALDCIPVVDVEQIKPDEQQKTVNQYTEDLIASARGELDQLKIIKSVQPNTEEEAKNEMARIMGNPSRLDHIRAFYQFTSSEIYPLNRFAGQSGFVPQHAYNFAGAGPVAGAADRIVQNEKNILQIIKIPSQRPVQNPFPACLKSLEGHTGWIRDIDMTPDGRRAISGSSDGTLKVWELESGRCQDTLVVTPEFVYALSMTPDGRRAITGSMDRPITIWDLESGKCLKTFENLPEKIVTVKMTADGRKAISVCNHENSLNVWDMENGKTLKTLKGHSETVKAASLTPDGRYAISGSKDKSLRLWDVENGKSLKQLKGHMDEVNAVALTPDGSRAVSGSNDGTLRVWDLKNYKCLNILEGHTHNLKAVDLTPDGRLAISGSNDETIRVWDLESGKCLKTLEGHTDSISHVSISADGTRAISGGHDKALKLWDLKNGINIKPNERHASQTFCVNLTPDGSKAVSSGINLKLWDPESGECLNTMEGYIEGINSLQFTPDGCQVVTGGNDKILRVLDLESGECMRTLEGHMKQVNAMILTPDGSRAISGSFDKTLKVWNLENGNCLQTLEGHMGSVDIVILTLGGRIAVSGSMDKTIRVWDLESGKCLKTIEEDLNSGRPLAITPDGRNAVSANLSRLRLWDLENGECLKTFEGHWGLIESLKITPDSRRAVSGAGSLDNSLRIWDLRTGECLKILEGHSDNIKNVSLTPDGLRAVSRSSDNTLRIWDLESGKCLGLEKLDGLLTISRLSGKGVIGTGTSSGDVTFFNIKNLRFQPSVITAERLWIFGRGDLPGSWENEITSCCILCGSRFRVEDKIINLINDLTQNTGLSKEKSPCLHLPDEAWDEPGLLSECPMCHNPIKFNPFIVDKKND